MTLTRKLLATILLSACPSPLSAQLFVDFNSTNQDGGPHPMPGYSSYDAGHENSNDFLTGREYPAFGTTVSLIIDYPDSSDNRVQQMIDRGGGNDANWTGSKLDLVTDWIGVDTRTGNGGNGNYDGQNGTPTRITLSLENLPASDYRWRSYHHDTEHMNGLFLVEFSTDGGGSYSQVTGPLAGGAFRQTDSTPGGSPDSARTYGGPTPESLPSTVSFDFSAERNQDVVVRFTPLSATAVHTQFAVINGFELTRTSLPDSPSEITLSRATVSRSASVGTVIGRFSSIDITPGDTHSYSLVPGTGDVNNGDFAILGDQLRTDRDLTVHSAGTTLSVRVRSTDLDGNSFEKVFPIGVVNDDDGDGLDDDWEVTWFGNTSTATGDGNNDGDLLTNLQEQLLGTNPTLRDSDGDGLADDQENGSGIFIDASNPGSSPLLADTDGDGLDDGSEISPDNGYITDPNLEDSDADGFSDPVEIAEATNPNNPEDFPDILLPLVLNEILARNLTGLRDGFGTREDWIEIYNPNPGPVNLDGYYLTDNPARPTKWNFPDVTIAGNDYLLVFASGINRLDPSGNPHANFSLEFAGEYLAIVRPDGTTLDDAFNPVFPEQFTDISYGPQTTDQELRFFSTPTPGSANGPGFPGVVRDTNFDFDRGFYDVPIAVTITSRTPDASIRYTTDGSLPSPTTGTLYSGPVTIDNTATLRAVAFKPGWLPTNVDTQTYIFVDKVARQPSNPPGWPRDWSNSGDPNAVHPSDYEMDPRVVDNTLPGYSVPEALLDIPSVSIAMEPGDFLNSEADRRAGNATGMYSNPRSRFERPCSIEYIRPDGEPGFQLDAKIEVHGNASRRPARMHKHSLRVTFTTEFGGPGRLEYPLFPESPVDRFNKLVLRACFTDSWGLVSWSSSRYRPNDSQYFRDVWMKDSLRDMGQPSSYGNFVHLYVNGLYFGLHNLTERLEDDFWAEHLGGEKEDWEVYKDLSGGSSRWTQMMSILNGGIESRSTYARAQNYIDVVNFADYMLLHFYADSEDWPHHNGYAAANPVSGDGKFRFWCWDQEIALDKFSWNRYSDARGAGAPFQRLRRNEEFRMLFADRAQKHLFNGGALSEQASIDRYLGLAGMIDKAIVAESARWGDTQATTPYGNTPGSSTNIDSDNHPPTVNNPVYFTREQHWIVERDNIVNNYIPTLHDPGDSRSFIRELRTNNLFPSVDAPVLSRFGGTVPTGFQLQLTGTEGTIHYTLDGSDPRLAGGGLNPSAQPLSTGLANETLLGFEAPDWRYLGGGISQSTSDVVAGHPSYNVTDWKHPDFNDTAWGLGPALLGGDSVNDISGESIATIVDIGPSGSRFPTVYFRKSFEVSDAGSYTALTAGVKRDDGAILYLNGHEIGRTNMPGGAVTYGTFASDGQGSSEESAINNISYTLEDGVLLEGTNVLAVEVHQSSFGSGDLGLDVRLTASKPAGPPTPVLLTQTSTLKARILSGGEWSALTEAAFIVGTPASADNLAVTEIMYNPIGAEEDSEYLELMNISPTEDIDLTNVQFSSGITYRFPAGFILAPHQRVTIVKDQAAFAEAYPAIGILIAPGTYTGSLSNSGEEIALQDAENNDIRRFTYDDDLPWPPSPDGLGFSLVLAAPRTDPDHSLPANWRASATPGGSPGSDDTIPFPGDPNADEDQDGRSAFFEYAVGGSDADPADSGGVAVGLTRLAGNDNGELLEYLEISFSRNLAADDAEFEAELSTDLQSWNTLEVEIVAIENHGDGTATYTYRSTRPFGARSREFLRLKVSSQEKR